MRRRTQIRVDGIREYTHDIACGSCGDDDPLDERSRVIGCGLRWQCAACVDEERMVQRRAPVGR